MEGLYPKMSTGQNTGCAKSWTGDFLGRVIFEFGHFGRPPRELWVEGWEIEAGGKETKGGEAKNEKAEGWEAEAREVEGEGKVEGWEVEGWEVEEEGGGLEDGKGWAKILIFESRLSLAHIRGERG